MTNTIYNENEFIQALEESFKMYKLHGARSTAKLKPIHKFVADTLVKIFGNGFDVHFLGDNNKEMTVVGKYYPKDVDITISKGGEAVFCLGIKFVTSNYKQNANNYFENMMGETANIQATQIPYAQLIILRHETPYYKKNETELSAKTEIINDKDIAKYLKLMYDQAQAHRPNYLGILLINIDEKTGNVSVTDLENSFSDETIKFLKNKLALSNFFAEIESYKDYLKLGK
ncbi:MAG: hypothetical protein LBU90_01380 [Bacteroidales bacterium]|jgi:hypothetical protein|nr:hypothetical protein [Bacteroidales bacterium]